MNENKRFKRLCSSIDYYYCIDKRNNDKGLTEADMLNMLNDLSDENEQLKQELKNQQDLNTVYTDFIKDKGYTIEDISKWSWKKYE